MKKLRSHNVVTQAELDSVVNLFNKAIETAVNIRRKMSAGASIEPGKWAAENFDGDPEPDFMENLAPGCTLMGLEIEPSASTKGARHAA